MPEKVSRTCYASIWEGTHTWKGTGGPSMGPHTPHPSILTPINNHDPNPNSPTSEGKGFRGLSTLPLTVSHGAGGVGHTGGM